MAALGALMIAATDATLAVLAGAYPLPVRTGQIEDATGYGVRYEQLTYRALRRLERLGQVERAAGLSPDCKSCYWRLAAPPDPGCQRSAEVAALEALWILEAQ